MNFAAVTVALVGAFVYQQSPLAAIQLLWVNLIMDSLASLALATETPTPELLKVPPVNRSTSMITRVMWHNILGQATYQIIITLMLLFAGYKWLGVEQGNEVEKDAEATDTSPESFGEPSTHYTIIFNSFVLMQLFNEINCRVLSAERNVFKGVLSNPYFGFIWVGTMVLQVIIVQYGGVAMSCVEGGLSKSEWGWCLLIGGSGFPGERAERRGVEEDEKYIRATTKVNIIPLNLCSHLLRLGAVQQIISSIKISKI